MEGKKSKNTYLFPVQTENISLQDNSKLILFTSLARWNDIKDSKKNSSIYFQISDIYFEDIECNKNIIPMLME